MTFIIGTPHTHNSGYYKNDDTPSGGKLAEADVQTCPHCQGVIKMQEWTANDGIWCSKCSKPVCNPCGDRMLVRGCEPFTQQLERFVAEQFRKEQNRKILGLED